MTGRKDREQDGRLDDLEDHDEEVDRRIDEIEEDRISEGVDQGLVDADQDERLDAIEDSTTGVDAELPGINTPAGAEQRLKLQVPTPLTHVTLGAIGNADAAQHRFGPGGFALKTVKNFAAEVHEHTIIDSNLNIILHTPENLTAVTGKKLHFSTNGDYQLGTVGGIGISAAAGAGFTDPAFTVDPQMAVPAPPTIDTKTPRSATEGAKDNWSAIWKAWDFYSGLTSLAKMRKDGLAKGLGKDTFAAKTSGLYSLYNNGKKVYDGLMAAGGAAIAAFSHSGPSEPAAGPGKPKITMYADEGVTILSPEKVTVFSTSGGVDIGSPHKVGIKAGVSASMKAGCDSSLFAFVCAKVESKMVSAIKGKIIAIDGELTEVKASTQLMINSKGILGVEADSSVRVSAKDKLEISAKTVIIGSSVDVWIETEDVFYAHAKNQANLWGDKKVYVKSDEAIEVKVKKTGFDCKDGEFKFGCDDKVGVRATSSQANIGTQKSYAIFKDGGFTIYGGGKSTIKCAGGPVEIQ